MVRIAGACGPVEQAVAEVELAASLDTTPYYLKPGGRRRHGGRRPDRARAVAEVLPVIGFYLQCAVGGPVLSLNFWRCLLQIPMVVASKAAPFDRYRTLDVARAIAESGRATRSLSTLATTMRSSPTSSPSTARGHGGPHCGWAARPVGGLDTLRRRHPGRRKGSPRWRRHGSWPG